MNLSSRTSFRSALASTRFFLLLFVFAGLRPVFSQEHSIAREWNEMLLTAIRNDFARPPVHARNLFHTAIALYDAWAVYEDSAETYFLGKTLGPHTAAFSGVPQPTDKREAQEMAMSYAVYRLMIHRFQRSPGTVYIYEQLDSLMLRLGYNTGIVSKDYSTGNPAALGNYLAEQLILFGRLDGANELNDYRNIYYEPVNPRLVIRYPGNPTIKDYNRWQPLTLDIFIDQAGNEIPFNTPPFQSPEWGQVVPFCLEQKELSIFPREGFDYWVYHDPGPPPQLDTLTGEGTSDAYKWNFSLVSIWGSHLDPADGVLWDISPASIGNIPQIPTDPEAFVAFYNELEGGDPGMGHEVNPYTGQPYEPQLVPRGDYTRVLAEFWADGPDSETPPGHWFTILNYVNDHPLFEKRFEGKGPVLDPLEWDVKAYLTLGGAMHDAAITAWGIKGCYDYIRPVSAIRAMADRGQSSDPSLPNYDPGGIPLREGFIELVTAGDPLAGDSSQHVGKVKVYSWRGPDHINNPRTDVAGVGWILAENWWPYQRPSFVTPPFAGYVSGHSAFSRAAAEVLTHLTGDPFFPGGMGIFDAPQNEFLVFEDGPSVDIELQWATYRDASDQTSLSRIWGGIHPPADDLPGRIIGETVGIEAFQFAKNLFAAGETGTPNKPSISAGIAVFPNPGIQGEALQIQVHHRHKGLNASLKDVHGRALRSTFFPGGGAFPFEGTLSTEGLAPGWYYLTLESAQWRYSQPVILRP